ncbi:MAG TPA: tRNA uridine-5-carboxymethylaminomethyl(34) synthesis enzyme MnmG, partial [Proteobacteria bacterium]|nr:tRNA uridine-5-carboxymethylaminomethyl(34) synthesis enzyme MnmG [Pseudomonadota bacterium]
PPRLDGSTIEFDAMRRQEGEHPIKPFSFWTERVEREQVCCYITRTNPRTHEHIRSGLDRSPLYTGVIKGIGPRYCPSIEDKVVRFPDRDSHLVFVEPEGLRSKLWYPNGISTSLPWDIQVKMVNSIEGLRRARIVRPGYAIEYDFVNPIELYPWLETKRVQGLFLAGQINGTSGYEEAAAQGIVAGINAALKLRGAEPIVFLRSESYIGVLIDDLVTKGVDEPYRMFTSRAEYRLLLREDNADLRLAAIGHRIGLLSDEQYAKVDLKRKLVEREVARLEEVVVNPRSGVNDYLRSLNTAPIRKPATLAELLRRPGLSYDDLRPLDPNPPHLPRHIKDAVEVEIKYAGYLARQMRQVERLRDAEGMRIPEWIDYSQVHGLSNELRQKLERTRPQTLAQAARIPGMTPAAIAAIQMHLRKRYEAKRRDIQPA